MYFDGKINSRKVNLGRSNNNAKPNDILAQVKSERENRQRSREESKAVAIIKKLVATKLELKQFEKEQKNIYFEQISQPDAPSRTKLENIIRRFLLFFRRDPNLRRELTRLCKVLLKSTSESDVSSNYLTSLFSTSNTSPFYQIRHILALCSTNLTLPTKHTKEQSNELATFLRTLLFFTDPVSIRAKLPSLNEYQVKAITDILLLTNQSALNLVVICRRFIVQHSTPVIAAIDAPSVHLDAIMTLLTRTIVASQKSNTLGYTLLFEVLNIPALFYRLSPYSQGLLLQHKHVILNACLPVIEQANFPPKPIMRLKHLGELTDEDEVKAESYASDDEDELQKKSEEETQKYVLGNVIDLFFKMGANDSKKSGERRKEKRPYPLDMYTHWPGVVTRVNILLKNMDKQNVERGALRAMTNSSNNNNNSSNNNSNTNVSTNNTNALNSSGFVPSTTTATSSFDQIFYHQLKQLYKTKTVTLLFQSIMTDKAAVSTDEFNNIFRASDLYCTLLDRMPHLSVIVLNKLTFTNSQRLLTALWKWLNIAAVLAQYLPLDFMKQLHKNAPKASIADQYKTPTVMPQEGPRDWVQSNRILTLFCAIYSHLLIVRDDEEFFNAQRPLNLFDNVMLIIAVKNFIFTLVAQKDPSAFTDEEYLLLSYGSRILEQLYERYQRHKFGEETVWLLTDKQVSFLKQLDNFLVQQAQFNASSPVARRLRQKQKYPQILRLMPFATPFNDRYLYFRTLVEEDREKRSIDYPIAMKIRRNSVLKDGFEYFSRLSPEMLKTNMKITFIDEFGRSEIGVDQGGLFKEFLILLIKESFRPEQGLFCYNSLGQIYPNPKLNLLHLQSAEYNATDNHDNIEQLMELLPLFKFLGQILAKAVYDGIVVDLPLAPFFLKKMLGKYNSLDELHTLDAELHKNLNFVKNYPGDVEDLSLTFSLTEDLFLGKTFSFNLVPGGENIAVTNENKSEYIHLMADFKLNKQIRKQTELFLKGFTQLIPMQWLKLFDQTELQWLIGGDVVDIDVADWKQNTKYLSCTASDSLIKKFWKIVEEFSAEERSQLLRFVTSCPRPPLLGFRYLTPQFCIQVVQDEHASPSGPLSFLGIGAQHSDRLPSASTCFNILKLPNYSSSSNMKERLKYAIKHNTGFELA